MLELAEGRSRHGHTSSTVLRQALDLLAGRPEPARQGWK
jgi:hypothetical protein